MLAKWFEADSEDSYQLRLTTRGKKFEFITLVLYIGTDTSVALMFDIYQV